jgi:hypothetical protein
MSNVKKIWIGIGVLVLLTPLGVALPILFKAKGAWGEWGLDEIVNVAGFVPAGMKQLGKIWKAPLADYGLPGWTEGLARLSVGYIVTAIIGVAFTAGIMYLLTKLLVRKNNQ